jgi:hypothetical protein
LRQVIAVEPAEMVRCMVLGEISATFDYIRKQWDTYLSNVASGIAGIDTAQCPSHTHAGRTHVMIYVHTSERYM